jgi:nitrogen regulatory protein PII
MKLVTAVVHPSALGDVRSALRIVDVTSMTVTESYDLGRGSSHASDATQADEVEFALRLRVEILVDDVESDFVAGAVAPWATTGHLGLAAVWVTTVETAHGIIAIERDAVAVA